MQLLFRKYSLTFIHPVAGGNYIPGKVVFYEMSRGSKQFFDITCFLSKLICKSFFLSSHTLSEIDN